MIAKLFEIRDKATFIPAVAVATEKRPDNTERENYLLGRAGYGLDRCVLLMKLEGGEAHYDPYDWSNPRTMGNAHLFITENFWNLESGAVIDVEFFLGETKAPKVSEAIEYDH